MSQVTEIFTKAKDHLRAIVGEAMAISVKENKKVIDKLDELKPVSPKDAKDYTNDLKGIKTAIESQEVAENVTILNPEAITGDLKAGLEGIITTLKDELKNFDKNIEVKNDFSNFASLFKTSQDKTAVIDALKKIEDKIKQPEITDYTLILSDIATALENKDAVSILKDLLVKDYNVQFPEIMAVDLDPNLIDGDRVKVKLPKDQVTSILTTASANNAPLVDAIQVGSQWLQQLGIDKDDATNYYFGFKFINEEKWRIKRLNKTTYAVDWASGESDSDTAWTGRTTQSYGNL